MKGKRGNIVVLRTDLAIKEMLKEEGIIFFEISENYLPKKDDIFVFSISVEKLRWKNIGRRSAKRENGIVTNRGRLIQQYNMPKEYSRAIGVANNQNVNSLLLLRSIENLSKNEIMKEKRIS